MNLKCQHIVIRTTSVSKAKEFYLGKLGLEVLEEAKNFFACKAGGVRLSFFEGYYKQEIGEDVKTGVSIVLRVENMSAAREEMLKKRVKINGDIIDIPGFHKFLEIEDDDGNILFLAEYEVEPV